MGIKVRVAGVVVFEEENSPLCDLGVRRRRQRDDEWGGVGFMEKGERRGARREIISRSCGFATLQMAGCQEVRSTQ